MESIEGGGAWGLFLFEKLKLLKNRIRIWNREVFGWIDHKVNEEVEKINEFERRLEDRNGEIF